MPAEKKAAETTETKKEVPVMPQQERKVKIKIPKTRKEQEDVFVSVNERTWLIKRGVEVEVPVCVAEVLQHAEEAREAAYEFETELQKKA